MMIVIDVLRSIDGEWPVRSFEARPASTAASELAAGNRSTRRMISEWERVLDIVLPAEFRAGVDHRGATAASSNV